MHWVNLITYCMERLDFIQRISASFEVHPIVAILGPRQCGKTTIARRFAEHKAIKPENYFDLEDLSYPMTLGHSRD